MPPCSLPHVFPTHLHNLLDDFCPGWTPGADGSPRQAGFCSQTTATKLSFGAALLYRNNLLDGVAPVLCCAIHDESECQNEHSANIPGGQSNLWSGEKYSRKTIYKLEYLSSLPDEQWKVRSRSQNKAWELDLGFSPVWPWTSHLRSLWLSFFICRIFKALSSSTGVKKCSFILLHSSLILLFNFFSWPEKVSSNSPIKSSFGTDLFPWLLSSPGCLPLDKKSLNETSILNCPMCFLLLSSFLDTWPC